MKKIIFFLSFFAICVLLFSTCTRWSKNSETDVTTDNVSPRLAELTKQLDASPDNHEIWHKRAQLHLELNMPFEGISDISKALQLDPENTSYLITLADIYFSMGHLDNCRKALIAAQDNDPNNVEPVLKLAELDLILKDYKKMNLYLNRALEIDNANAQVFFMKGIALKEQGDSLAALRNLHQATFYDPEHYKAFVEAGILASELKDPIALEYLSTALNLNPVSIQARYALAMYYQNNAMLNEAMTEYYNILNIDKNHAHAHFNLGYIHLVYLQMYRQAIGHFTDAIQANPNYVEAYYNRGYSYELLGNVEAARKDYKEALARKNNYRKAIDGLNRIERK